MHLRECYWNALLENAKVFYEKYGIEIPDLHIRYIIRHD